MNGRVFAVFGRAIYVSDGDALRVLVDHRAPRGPLHLRVRKLPSLRVGEPVQVDGLTLRYDGGQANIEEPWVGSQPHQSRLATLDVAEVARRLGGKGPGLTPEGDDLLAGVLLARWGVCDEAGRATLLAIARGVDTNRISLAYMEVAAQGQCIEPAHDLLVALVGADDDAAAKAEAELTTYGATSGAALARGIRAELADADVDELCG